ncbi:MAG: MBL fold metallo-hydrolase [Acidisphaera sp.]|nr:MBL fold metallo-hydrolase [Acidisphaera sp.]
MRVTVLGCGGSAGVPLIGGADGHGEWGVCDPREARNRRSRASILVQGRAGQRLLVDTSPDLRSQLLRCGVPQVDAIVFTHAHADHVTGLDDVRILNRIARRPLEAFADAATLEELTRRFDYAFRPWQPPSFFRPVLTQHQVAPGQTMEMAGMDVTVLDQDHGFVHTIGLRIGDFAYSTDVVALDDTAFSTLAGIDTWVISCFQRAPHPTHAGLDRVLEWVARLAPRRAVLTHMGTDMDWAWLQANLPPGVEPAEDGMVLELPG